MVAESRDVVIIHGARLKAVSELKHEGRSDAAHRYAAQHPHAIQRSGWVHRIFRRLTEDAVPTGVEHKAVQVDGPVRGVAQHRIPHAIFGPIKAPILQWLEGALKPRNVGEMDRKIQIAMGTRLLAQQRVNTPAPIDPKGKARTLKGVAKIDDCAELHHRLGKLIAISLGPSGNA